MPKISDPVYPSQTGAQVANGDLMYIVDVGTPNISEKITVNELAQAPQFSSRYVPIADDHVWIPAGAMLDGEGGSPTIGKPGLNWGTSVAWMLDATTQESITSNVVLPNWWQTFSVSVWWTNAASTSGNVVIEVWGRLVGDGDSADGSALTFKVQNQTLAAPTTVGEVEVSTFTNNALWINSAGKALFLAIRRMANDAADTLANDIGVYGVRIARTS